jgi:D-sedoheptulose 7-phosphate isomerase
MKTNAVLEIIKSSISVKSQILSDNQLISDIVRISELITDCFNSGGKVLFCGNGGSAADAQHLAAEFSGRFYKDRAPLFSESLSVNTSYLTAVANDYAYDEVYARLVRAMGRPGDILVAISTSGNSNNIIKAVEAANDLDMITIGLTGLTGGRMIEVCKELIKVPSKDTPRIQESHIMIGHIICELVESSIFK